MHIIMKTFNVPLIGTFGEIKVIDGKESIYSAVTVERPWLNNVPAISCIPAGNYILKKHNSEKYPNTYAIVGGTVSHYPQKGFERSTCLFHVANTPEEVRGCVGIGESYGTPYQKWGVVSSKKATGEFLDILNGSHEKHTLSIIREAL